MAAQCFFLTGIHWLLVTKKRRSPFPAQSTAKINCRLVNQYL